MKVIRWIFLLSIFLNAFTIPTKVYTTITSVNGDRVTLQDRFFYNGMSGIVLRDTNSGEYALVYIKQTPNGAVIIDKDPVGGDNIAKIKPNLKVGDRVIGGFLYDKVLILAPKDRYNQILSQLNVKAINPLLFEAFLASKGLSANRDSFKKFAKLAGIGLVVVSKGNKIELIDAISTDTIYEEEIK